MENCLPATLAESARRCERGMELIRIERQKEKG